MKFKKVEIWQFLMSFSNAITYSNYIPLILLLNPSPILRKILIAGREIFRIFSVSVLSPFLVEKLNTNRLLKFSALFYTLSFLSLFFAFLFNNSLIAALNLIFYLFAFSGAFARNIIVKKYEIQEDIFLVAYFAQILAFIFALSFEKKSLALVLLISSFISLLGVFFNYEDVKIKKERKIAQNSKKILIFLAFYVFLLSYRIAVIKQPHRSYLYLLIAFILMLFALSFIKFLSKFKISRVLLTSIFSFFIFLFSFLNTSLIIFYLLRMSTYLLIDFVQIEKEFNKEIINAYTVGYSSAALALFLFS